MPLDIGVGIIISVLVSHWFGVPLTPALLLFGIVSALLPDIDMLPIFWSTAYNHRNIPHYPIVYVPLAIAVYGLLGPAYGTLFALGVFLHLVHDTLGIGWGVTWFWPFSKCKFLFLPVARMQTYGLFMTWMPEEEAKLGADYHDPQWVKRYYFSPHPIAFIEYGALILSLAILVYALK